MSRRLTFGWLADSLPLPVWYSCPAWTWELVMGGDSYANGFSHSCNLFVFPCWKGKVSLCQFVLVTVSLPRCDCMEKDSHRRAPGIFCWCLWLRGKYLWTEFCSECRIEKHLQLNDDADCVCTVSKMTFCQREQSLFYCTLLGNPSFWSHHIGAIICLLTF